MSSPAEPNRFWHMYPLGMTQPFAVSYGGLKYTGEVIRSDHWDHDWGLPLEGDEYFRIVLLVHRRQVPSSDIHDSRIAVCIPGRRPSRVQQHVDKELTTIRETQALYVTQRRPDTEVLRKYLERQGEELETQLASEEAARYAGGRIESPTVFAGGIQEFFARPELDTWIEGIATSLLSWAYPALPLDSSLFPRTITLKDIADTYEAIFATNIEDRAPLGEFGPGLGLCKPQLPLDFDPGECRVFQEIRAELDSHHGEIQWKDVHVHLAHASGLTRPLATLYLLGFVYYGQPETEMLLAPDHHLVFRDGRPVRGSRLTKEFIPYLSLEDDHSEWGSILAQSIAVLRLYRGEVTWNDALQYTSLLCQGLTELEEGSRDLADQERELLDSLHELAGDLREAGRVLETLARSIPSPNQERLLADVQRLWQISEAGNFQEVYQLARGAFPAPQDLLQMLDLVRRILYLGESLEEIIDTKAYLDGAEIQSGYRQLSFDRSTLMEEMSLPLLLASIQGWPTVKGHIHDYQARYGRAYDSHHTYYQREASRLSESLEDSRLKLHALTLLNTVKELGEPVGLDLEQRHSNLERGIWPCNVDPGDIPLSRNPRCGNCLMVLGEKPPAQELESLLRDLNRALGEQNRRLSRLLVDRILHDMVDERLEDFLKIVNSSDLSALSNTLNDELVVFIRQLLRSP